MLKYPILLCLLFSAFLVSAQSEKEIKQNKIKSITTWSTDNDEGNTSPRKEMYESFDKNGNTLIRIKYKKDGSVNSKETFKYDKNQNKTEEIEYDGENKVVSHKAYAYNSFQKKTEELEYNPAGGLVKKTTFTYTPSGEKATETVSDPKGGLIKQTEYKYSAKNLRIQKITTNKSKQVESTKKWAYEFY